MYYFQWNTCEAHATKLVALQPDILHGIAVGICRARTGLRVAALERLSCVARMSIVSILDSDLVDRQIHLIRTFSALEDLAAGAWVDWVRLVLIEFTHVSASLLLTVEPPKALMTRTVEVTTIVLFATAITHLGALARGPARVGAF